MKKHIKEIINGNIYYHGPFLGGLLLLFFIISGIMGWKTEDAYPLFFRILIYIWVIDLFYVFTYWVIFKMIIRQWIVKKH